MTRIMKRLTAVLIALILLAGLLPMTAFAADGDTHAITLEFNDQYGFAKVGNNLTEGWRATGISSVRYSRTRVCWTVSRSTI